MDSSTKTSKSETDYSKMTLLPYEKPLDGNKIGNKMLVEWSENKTKDHKVTGKKSHFLDALGKIMEDKEFRNFFNTYCQNWTECQSSLMFMHTYAFIDEKYYLVTKRRLTSDQIVYLIKNSFMKDPDRRKIMIDGWSEFMNNKQFLDTFTKVIDENKEYLLKK